MKQFFFEAKDAANKLVHGSVQADSAEDALLKLKQRSLLDIKILSTDFTASMRDDLAKLSPELAQQHAREEIAYRQTKSGTESFLLGVLNVTRKNAALILAAAALTGWGIRQSQAGLAGFGILLMLLPYALFVWNLRHLDHFKELQRAMVYGEWSVARRMIAKLRSRPNNNDSIQMELDVREAQINIREGMSVDQAMASLERWRQHLANKPGAFAARAKSLYFAARDYTAYLNAARENHEMAPQDSTRQVDYALAEARLGDTTKAKTLMDTVDLATLVPAGHKFLDWGRGLVALREGKPDAISHLEKAVQGFDVMSRKTPTSLSTFALSSAAYSVALARNGKKDQALKILKSVERILRVSIDPPLQQQLETELGWKV